MRRTPAKSAPHEIIEDFVGWIRGEPGDGSETQLFWSVAYLRRFLTNGAILAHYGSFSLLLDTSRVVWGFRRLLRDKYARVTARLSFERRCRSM